LSKNEKKNFAIWRGKKKKNGRKKSALDRENRSLTFEHLPEKKKAAFCLLEIMKLREDKGLGKIVGGFLEEKGVGGREWLLRERSWKELAGAEKAQGRDGVIGR